MFDGISIWQLLILLAIVLVVFGSKRLRNIGPDIGSALKGFRQAMKDDDTKKSDDPNVVEHSDRDSTVHRDTHEQPDSSHSSRD